MTEDEWLASIAKECRNCQCAGVPCGGCQQGGFCDDMCWCGARDGIDDEPYEAQSSDDLDAAGELP